MKTFRLRALSIVATDEQSPKRQKVILTEGLIINTEDEAGNWLIEAVIPDESVDILQTPELQEGPFIIEATITKEQNAPAPFTATIREMKTLDNHTEILLDAKMIVKKDDLSDILLKELIEEGLTGDDLIKEFKRVKAERGPSFKGIVEKELKKMKSTLPN